MRSLWSLRTLTPPKQLTKLKDHQAVKLKILQTAKRRRNSPSIRHSNRQQGSAAFLDLRVVFLALQSPEESTHHTCTRAPRILGEAQHGADSGICMDSGEFRLHDRSAYGCRILISKGSTAGFLTLLAAHLTIRRRITGDTSSSQFSTT